MLETIERNVPGHSSFGLEGDFDFYEDSAVLHFVIPMRTLRALITGPESRNITINRKEVIALLHVILKNPATPTSDLEIIKSLLSKA